MRASSCLSRRQTSAPGSRMAKCPRTPRTSARATLLTVVEAALEGVATAVAMLARAVEGWARAAAAGVAQVANEVVANAVVHTELAQRQAGKAERKAP